MATDKATARHEQRERQEQDATQRISRAAGINDQDTIKQIAGAINYLHADWFNASTHQHAQDITQELERLEVGVRISHFTGDSSYATEYTISHEKITGTGPTFDLALIEFIAHLLQQKGKSV